MTSEITLSDIIGLAALALIGLVYAYLWLKKARCRHKRVRWNNKGHDVCLDCGEDLGVRP